MADQGRTAPLGLPAAGARLRIARKHQPWTTLTPRVEIAVDGVPIGELDQGEVVEGSVEAGSHELAVRTGRGARWQATTVRLESGDSQGVLVSTVDRRRPWTTLAYLALAMLPGAAAVDAGDPEVRFDDLAHADPGRPANVTRVVWLVFAGVVAATLLIEPFAAVLVALVGLITVLLARVQAGARRHLRRSDVLPPWRRARLSLR
jgi:hypothetical protein